MNLLNNISNETTMLLQNITKVSTLMTSDADAEVKNNVAGTQNSVQLRPTQQGAEFLPTLSNDI